MTCQRMEFKGTLMYYMHLYNSIYIYNYIYIIYIYTSTSGIVEKDCLEVILVVSSGNVQECFLALMGILLMDMEQLLW